MKKIKSLTLIIKLTERCNLNCSYCYYFNGNDYSFKSKPAVLKKILLNSLIKFIIKGIEDYEITNLSIVFHGGEPLLIPQDYFIEICETLKINLSPLVKLSLGMQTNGTLVNAAWIDIFRKYSIGLGISIDGPKEYHNIYRIDHKGKGSYDKISKAIELLRSHNYPFRVLSVVNPKNNPEVVYNHFIHELGIKFFDFLLPYYTHNEKLEFTAEEIGEYIIALFKKWTEEDNSDVEIRILNSYLNMFIGKRSSVYGHYGSFNEQSLHLLMIRSDGELSTTDELMSTHPETVTMTGKNIINTTLKEFFDLPIFTELAEAFTNTPDACKTCCWENICGGGEIVNRFSYEKRFNNPSIYCAGLKNLYSEIYQYLIAAGVSSAELKQRLIA